MVTNATMYNKIMIEEFKNELKKLQQDFNLVCNTITNLNKNDDKELIQFFTTQKEQFKSDIKIQIEIIKELQQNKMEVL